MPDWLSLFNSSPVPLNYSVSRNMHHRHAILDRYQVDAPIGFGSFSVVKRVTDSVTGQSYACKIIPATKLVTARAAAFENEVRILQQLSHPGVIRLFDLLKDDSNYYIIMELCEHGELFHYIVDNGRLSELESRYFLKQILEALRYVHNQGVVHRDIKPENILLDVDGHVKLSDFGLSRFVNAQGLADTPCGSVCYASPECVSGIQYDGRKSDIWSVGVVAYAMLTGVLPWTKQNQVQLIEQIRKADFQIPGFVSEGARDLIRKLMEPDPAKRISVEEALQHPWIASAPSHRFRSKEPKLMLSLKYVDRFFGRENSDVVIDDKVLMRSGSVSVNRNFENMLRIIVPKQQRNTSRETAKQIVFARRCGSGKRMLM